MRRRVLPVAGLFAVALSAVVCRPVETGRVEPPQRLLLVMIDTLRPDHLGAYGYPQPTSRKIDELAADGVLFERAYSTSSWTKPAIASLFTGVGPLVHGVEQGLLPEMRRGETDALSDGFPTLAQAFRDRGFAAVAFSANPHVAEATGLVRGFDTARSLPASRDHVASQFLEWLNSPLAFRVDSAQALSSRPENSLRGWFTVPIETPDGIEIDRSPGVVRIRRAAAETDDSSGSRQVMLPLRDLSELATRRVFGALYRTQGRASIELVRDCEKGSLRRWVLPDRRVLGLGYEIVEPHRIDGCSLDVRAVLVEPGSEIEIRSLFLLPETAVRSERTDRWFAYLHFMNTHLPYRPSPLYAGLHPVDAATEPEPIPEAVLEQVRSQGLRDTTDLRVYRSRYDAAIDQVDDQLRVILDRLASLDLLAGTVVVVMSDHGEEFLEHGGLSHGHSLYGELVRIPMILHAPEHLPRGRRVAQRVSLLDLYPTLVELFGLEGPDYLIGRSLLGARRDDGSAGEPYFMTHLSMSVAAENRLEALIDGDWKLILAPASGSVELYDLASDPGERRNVSALHPAEVERLRAELERRRAAEMAMRDGLGHDPARTTLDERTVEELRSLGYVN